MQNKITFLNWMKTDPILKKYETSGMHNQINVKWTKADGSFIYSGRKKIIDFTSSIFVANIGHGNKNYVKNLKKNLSIPLIHSYNYINNNRIEYIKELKKFLGNDFNKIYLLSTGSEASEAALKLMRLYALKKKEKKTHHFSS